MKLVDDVRDCWKWFSLRANALNATLLTTWLGLPADMKSSIPGEYVAYMAIFLLVIGSIGRVVDQK